MIPNDVAAKIRAKLTRLDEARLAKPDWLIGRLQEASRSERSEAIRECYRLLIQQVGSGNSLALFSSLEGSEGKALLLDLKDLLALWTNIKSMAAREKVQVNIQISQEAKNALKQLASRDRVSQGEVIEALLLNKIRRPARKRTFERAKRLPDMPTSDSPQGKD